MTKKLKPIFDKASKIGIALTAPCLALAIFTSYDKPAIAAGAIFSAITIISIAGWAICEVIAKKKSRAVSDQPTPRDP
jgi:hypothetical protein